MHCQARTYDENEEHEHVQIRMSFNKKYTIRYTITIYEFVCTYVFNQTIGMGSSNTYERIRTYESIILSRAVPPTNGKYDIYEYMV